MLTKHVSTSDHTIHWSIKCDYGKVDVQDDQMMVSFTDGNHHWVGFMDKPKFDKQIPSDAVKRETGKETLEDCYRAIPEP